MIFEGEEIPEMPDLSFLEDLGGLMNGLGGFLELIQSFSTGLTGIFEWATANLFYFILIMIGVMVGSWLLTTLFMWIAFILLKKQENFGKVFVTSFENFLIGTACAFIPIIGVIIALIAEMININRRHETGGWATIFIWCFGYLITFGIIAVIFIGAGGLPLIEELVSGLLDIGL